MAVLFVLFENATGYSLFKVPEFEESSSIVKVHESIRDISAFGNIVEPVSFKPFTSGRDALENMSSASTGVLHPSLQQFLESNLPKSKKKHPVMLGVADSKLGAVITEALGVSCSVSGIVPDILRGIRLHYHKLIKDVRDQTSVIDAQKGLSHHYCRATLKYNVGKVDNMIIQSINIIDQLDKDINNFSMRVREWYSHHFPELIKVVPENHFYIQCVSAIQNRKNMPEDIKEKLETILMDSAKAQDIIELARTSMGMEISVLDMENVTTFAKRINALIIRRKELMEYLKSKMHNIAPNLATLIGDVVGARLIAHAGSLVNLAKFPASTVQILGAEKALFRALKTRGNTPKYGLIYHSSYIGRAGKANKGRISRYLANKCVVASRIDFFREIPTEVFGTKLKQQVEDRLKFYETGEIPAKNVDVMSVALEEADLAAVSVAKEKRKAEKREKKRRSQLLESITQNSFNASTNEDNGEILEENVSPKKKRKRLSEQSENASFVDGNEDNEISEHDSSAKKKNKKRKLSEQLADVSQNSVNTVEDNEEASEQNMTSSEKKKKKKHKYMEVSEIDVSSPHNQAEVEETEITDPEILRQIRKAKKKEKKRLKALQASMNSTGEDSMFSNNESMFTNDSINSSMNTPSKVNEEEHLDNGIKKKKKKKKNKHQDEECEA